MKLQQTIQFIIYFALLFYLHINILSLIYVILYKQKFPKEDLYVDESPIHDMTLQIVGDDGPVGRHAV